MAVTSDIIQAAIGEVRAGRVQLFRASGAEWLPVADDALARLFGAVDEHDQPDDNHSWETCFIAVVHAAEALAEAITHRSGT